MKCGDLLAEYSHCRRGMPVAAVFRQYFCEGNHARCPLKRDVSVRKGKFLYRTKDFMKTKEEL